MNKKFKRIFAIGALVILSGSAIGCGGSDSSSGGGSSSGGSSGGGSTPAGAVTIDFWHTFGQSIIDELQPQINEFVRLVKRNEGVDVRINLVPQSNYETILDNISKGIPVGNIPTLAVAYPDHVADYLNLESTPGQYMVNLEEYANNSVYGLGKDAYLGDREGDTLDSSSPNYDFIPAYIEGGRHFARSGMYTFPYMQSTESMLYNYEAIVKVLNYYKPEFEGAKNKITEYMNNLDWEEFMNLCQQVQNYKHLINNDLVRPAFYDSDSNLFISQLYQAGVNYSSVVNGSGKIDFATGEDRAKAEAIVGNLRKNANDGLLHTKGTFSTYGSNSFKNKECVFVVGSTGGSGYSLTTDFEIGVCKVPYVKDGEPLYVTQGPSLAIFKNPSLGDSVNSQRAIYAWKFIKFLTNTKNNVKMCLKGSEGYSPVRRSCYQDQLYLDFLDSVEVGDDQIKIDIANCVYFDINGKYFSTPCFVGSAYLRTQVGGIITEALSTNTSISSIFDIAIENATMKIK